MNLCLKNFVKSFGVEFECAEHCQHSRSTCLCHSNATFTITIDESNATSTVTISTRLTAVLGISSALLTY